MVLKKTTILLYQELTTNNLIKMPIIAIEDKYNNVKLNNDTKA